MQLSFPSGPWWRRWNLAVRVGCVDVTPLSHLLAVAVLALLVRESARQAPAEAALLGLTPADAPAVALLLYGLLQGGRLVHEAGHACAGVLTGLPLTALRLTPLFMAADFPDEALWRAPASSRRLTALAGSTAEATFGVVLLVIAAVFGAHWPAIVQETVFLCGALHLAALANLLPVAQADGHLLFGRAWVSRPAWLSQLPAMVLASVPPVALTAVLFEHGAVRIYLASLLTPSGYIPFLVALATMLPLSRRLLFPRRPAGMARRTDQLPDGGLSQLSKS